MSLTRDAAVNAAASARRGWVSGLVVMALAGTCWLSPSRVFGETRTVTIGPEYDASGFWKLWFGSAYRDLWTTPVELEVLDLENESGGLSVVRTVGGRQTLGLALLGADGRAYTFRVANKDPSRMLPEEWQDTLPARVFRDQTAASHPGSAQVVVPLRAAVGGILQAPPWRLVVMPDSEALGEYRARFGGVAGTLTEYPTPARDGDAGFHGAEEILSSEELWNKWHEGPGLEIDVRAFLRARLMNLFVGDWDRHYEQWRWALLPDEAGYQPIPEDPDQAFSDYGGEMLRLARWRTPRLLRFQDEIAGMTGAVFNGRDVDRWLLAGLDRREFIDMAGDLRSRATDGAIENAVKNLEPEWYAAGGAELAAWLERRRESLGDAAERFYLHLATAVNIHCTDVDELARINRFEDGSLEVTVSVSAGGGPAAEPYYRRRFDPKETKEVRLYLAGGDDRVVSEGPAKGAIKVRVLGGLGNDVLDDSRSGYTRFIDYRGVNEVIAGKGTKHDERPWKHPAPIPGAAPWLEPSDFGARTIPAFMAWWEPAVRRSRSLQDGVGFPKVPQPQFQSRFCRILDGSSLGNVRVRGCVPAHELEPVFHRNRPRVRDRLPELLRLRQRDAGRRRPRVVSGRREPHLLLPHGQPRGERAVSVLRRAFRPVHRRAVEADAHQNPSAVRQRQVRRNRRRRRIQLGQSWPGGACARSDSRRGSRCSATTTQDDRDEARDRRRVLPRSLGRGGDLRRREGELSGYVGLGTERLGLAARVGGRKVWGEFPWHEAAFVGGPDTNRGLREQRFAGDASLFGNLELRIQLFNGRFLLPGRYWLFGLADAGRVWVDGEDSEEWHPSFGGGLAVDVMGTGLSFWIGAAHNEDQGTRGYVRSGVTF